MAKKMTRRQQQSEANKRKIVDCAMNLFAKHGYDNVSIDDIAKFANSSKGSFYNYFRSKDELFVFYRQTFDTQYADFYQKLLYDSSYATHNGLQKFYLMCMFILKTISSNGHEFARVCDMRLLKDTIVFNEENATRGNYNLILHDLIKMGKNDGSIRKDLSSEQIIHDLHLYFDGIMYHWEVSKGSFNIIDTYSYIIEFYCYGISRLLE